jgi:hypothetical protein
MNVMTPFGAVVALVAGLLLIGVGVCVLAAFILAMRSLWCAARDAWREIGQQ